jgi:hypothetical protein
MVAAVMFAAAIGQDGAMSDFRSGQGSGGAARPAFEPVTISVVMTMMFAMAPIARQDGAHSRFAIRVLTL